MADKIVKRMPEHACYVEAFAGAGWVFFRKDPSEVEILNDKNSDLVALLGCFECHLKIECDVMKNFPDGRKANTQDCWKTLY